MRSFDILVCITRKKYIIGKYIQSIRENLRCCEPFYAPFTATAGLQYYILEICLIWKYFENKIKANLYISCQLQNALPCLSIRVSLIK